MQAKKQQLELYMEQQTGSKLGKEHVQAVYHHPAYLTYMQSSVQFSTQFFSTQFSLWPSSHIHMTTGKTIALTRWTFVGKVMSLLFNILSRLVIAFLPRSKLLSISQLQLPSALIFEPPKIKFLTVSIVFHLLVMK